jgi:hypothetical protein
MGTALVWCNPDLTITALPTCLACLPCSPAWLREAEVKRVPLMGDREPLEALAVEYEAGSDIYRQKIDKLKEQYCSIRWVAAARVGGGHPSVCSRCYSQRCGVVWCGSASGKLGLGQTASLVSMFCAARH